MKKLNTNIVGRMPLWQADIDFLQQGWQEVVTAIVRELGLEKKYFVLTGCVPFKPSAKFLQMPAGWVWWNGRILPVRALPATDVTSFANPVVRLASVTQNYIQDGARNFVKVDQTVQQVTTVWQDDYITPTVVERSATATSGIRLGIGCWTLKDMLAHSKAEAESDWTYTSDGSNTLSFKRVGRIVSLRGIVEEGVAYSGLPAPIQGETYIPSKGGTICIRSNGEMVWIGTQEDRVNGIMYMAATPYTEDDPNTIDDNPVD